MLEFAPSEGNRVGEFRRGFYGPTARSTMVGQPVGELMLCETQWYGGRESSPALTNSRRCLSWISILRIKPCLLAFGSTHLRTRKLPSIADFGTPSPQDCEEPNGSALSVALARPRCCAPRACNGNPPRRTGSSIGSIPRSTRGRPYPWGERFFLAPHGPALRTTLLRPVTPVNFIACNGPRPRGPTLVYRALVPCAQLLIALAVHP